MKFRKGQRVRTKTWDEYNELTGVITEINAGPVLARSTTRLAVQIDSGYRKGSTALFYEEELEVIE